MATYNNPIIKNFPPLTTTNTFNQIWAATRMMKKAGWNVFASSDNTAKAVSVDPELDRWCGTLGTVGGITNAGGAAAAIGVPSRGRCTITGLTGIVAADKGRFIRFTGAANAANNHAHQIEEVLDATSVRVNSRNFTLVTEGGVTWVIRDPQVDTYPTTLNTVDAWIGLQGPSVIVVPFTVAPVGDFQNGEIVAQVTSGAQGLVQSWTWDGTNGKLIILPTQRGVTNPLTGYGWDSGLSVVGGTSGASITQSSAALEYIRQLIIWKDNNLTTGSMFWGNFNLNTDTAEQFNTIASAAGCTATVAPGGGGTGNAFPTHAYVWWGTDAVGAGISWFRSSTSVLNMQAGAADALEELGQPADGSWWFGSSVGDSADLAFQIQGFAYQILDNTEPGDVDPYISWRNMASNTLYANARTNAGVAVGVTQGTTFRVCVDTSANRAYASGWAARGLSNERYQDMEHTTPGRAGVGTGSSNLIFDVSVPQPFRQITVTGQPNIGMNIEIWISDGPVGSPNYKSRKGRIRWMKSIIFGRVFNVYQDTKNPTKYYLQMVNSQLTPLSRQPMIIGPWNGAVDAVPS